VTDSARARDDGPIWTGELDYALPHELIAQRPAPVRTDSRLMVVDRASSGIAHHRFSELVSFLRPGDLLVANDSAVFRARLHGRKPTGGEVEILLLEARSRRTDGAVHAMVRASKAVREGQQFILADGTACEVVESKGAGRHLVVFRSRQGEGEPAAVAPARVAERLGEVPLPPYIERPDGPVTDDDARYRTVYAREQGSVAAPTAGLHFTQELIGEAAAAGVGMAFVTLHVGPGTFLPMRGAPEEHRMEEEWCGVSQETADRICETRARGGRLIAVGTTTVRTLESAARAFADGAGPVGAWEGRTDLFIRPGHEFRVIDGLITNFHLPASTLLCLVMALAGEARLRSAYEQAIRERYRFYSYGDAMLVV
jgi:S-adenosylmethionine:tRNA ribosyltransferase-isomerase